MAYIQTNASSAGGIEFEVRRAPADVASRPVDARAVETVVRVAALVDVGTVPSSLVELVASVALTAEHSDEVLAATVHAQVTKHLTLVDVWNSNGEK